MTSVFEEQQIVLPPSILKEIHQNNVFCAISKDKIHDPLIPVGTPSRVTPAQTCFPYGFCTSRKRIWTTLFSSKTKHCPTATWLLELHERKLSSVMDWMCRSQWRVVQMTGRIARQFRLLWGHMKYTVKFCEVFMMMFDIYTCSCFGLTPSCNIQENHNVLEDDPCSVLGWWGSGNETTLVDSLKSHSHPLDLVTEDGASFWNMLCLYVR